MFYYTIILAVLTILLFGESYAAAEGDGSKITSPTTLLDDSTVIIKTQEIIQEIQNKHLIPGQKIDPRLITIQLTELQNITDKSMNHSSHAVLSVRILIGSIQQREYDDTSAEVTYNSVLHDAQSAEDTTAVIDKLAELYFNHDRIDDLTKLVQFSEKRKLDPKMVESLNDMIASEKILVIGQKLNEFSLVDLQGNKHTLAEYKGKVLLINFWATWCPDCLEDMPSVQACYNKLHAQGFEILGINMDIDRRKVEKYIQLKQIQWPQIYDGKGWQSDYPKLYCIKDIPETFLIDPSGTLIKRHLHGDHLEPAIRAALPVISNSPRQ